MGNKVVNIVGGGLAGVEAAWQALKLGAKVRLFEMRPLKMTEAHKSGDLGELVCSNSLKSLEETTAPGRLKQEMKSFESLVVSSALKARVPAGSALAVDRRIFSEEIVKSLSANSNFERIDEEIVKIPSMGEMEKSGHVWIIASGPLTSKGLAAEIGKLCGDVSQLYFYDSIAPILSSDTLDTEFCFKADRYGKGTEDYINLALDKTQYLELVNDILEAEKTPLHSFEKASYFESCLPIEVMAERGVDTLRFGPLKPVGIIDPRTGQRPYANIQLRMENKHGTMHSMVGFQTKMKWPEQKRVFAKIPALKNAEFLRFGSVHRNTYVQSPKVLSDDLSFKKNPRVFLAGQITGVEGYTESAAIGMLAGLFAADALDLGKFIPPPSNTFLGALLSYVTQVSRGSYAPMNANLGLLPSIKREKGMSKLEKKAKQCHLSKLAFDQYFEKTDPFRLKGGGAVRIH